MAPATTRVLNRAAGPSTVSAATAVMSFAVDAGCAGELAPLDHSTVAGGGIGDHPPDMGTERGKARIGARAADRPPLVGSGADRCAGRRTGPGAATGAPATRGMSQRASRGGSRRGHRHPRPQGAHVEHGQRDHCGSPEAVRQHPSPHEMLQIQ